MPRLITGPELRAAVEQKSFIKNGEPRNAEDVKYDFRLSKQILKAKFGRPIDANRLSPSEAAELVVEPGEVVFVLSEETLSLPLDMVAQLSPKRKMSQAGVLTLGGLTIDPGYEGPLLVGLLNFSSTPFVLQPGRKLIAATFYHLTADEQKDLKGVSESLGGFPEELVDVMQKYRPVGTKYVMESLERLQQEIEDVRQDLKRRDEWKERLDRHDSQIGQLIQGLKEEKEARERGEDRFTKAIQDLTKTFHLVKGGAIALWAVLAVILIPLLLRWLPEVIRLLRGE